MRKIQIAGMVVVMLGLTKCFFIPGFTESRESSDIQMAKDSLKRKAKRELKCDHIVLEELSPDDDPRRRARGDHLAKGCGKVAKYTEDVDVWKTVYIMTPPQDRRNRTRVD
jgi:hypothetical protein